MESEVGPLPPVDREQAAAALAAIDEQRQEVAARLRRYAWLYPALGVSLGLLAASLLWHDEAWFVVVVALYALALVPVLGTPVRLGVVPRDGPRGAGLLAGLVLLGAPQVAAHGPGWAPIAVGVFVAGFVTGFGRWRLAAMRADLRSLARQEKDRHPPRPDLADRIGLSAPYPVVAAVVTAASVIALGTPNTVLIFVGLIAYWMMMYVIIRIQSAVGELAKRPPLLVFFGPALLMVGMPILLVQDLWPGRWWPTSVCAVVAAVNAAFVARWQRAKLATGVWAR